MDVIMENKKKIYRKIKKKCDRCGKMRRELTFYNGKLLCGKCRSYGTRKAK
jgi:formylmethanofuran dehydrogenase subunit E